MSQQLLDKHRPGTYLASPVDWGISKTKAGLPQVVVCFRYENGDLLWWGSFKDTVVERTVDTLIAMGLKGSLETLADGVPGGALDSSRQMEIVIEHRAGNDGVLRPGIAWVNDPNKSRIEKITKAEAGSLLSGMNAVLLQRRGQTKVAPPAPVMQQSFTEQDVPF
jgi:hypothetical protein